MLKKTNIMDKILSSNISEFKFQVKRSICLYYICQRFWEHIMKAFYIICRTCFVSILFAEMKSSWNKLYFYSKVNEDLCTIEHFMGQTVVFICNNIKAVMMCILYKFQEVLTIIYLHTMYIDMCCLKLYEQLIIVYLVLNRIFPKLFIEISYLKPLNDNQIDNETSKFRRYLIIPQRLNPNVFNIFISYIYTLSLFFICLLRKKIINYLPAGAGGMSSSIPVEMVKLYDRKVVWVFLYMYVRIINTLTAKISKIFKTEFVNIHIIVRNTFVYYKNHLIVIFHTKIDVCYIQHMGNRPIAGQDMCTFTNIQKSKLSRQSRKGKKCSQITTKVMFRFSYNFYMILNITFVNFTYMCVFKYYICIVTKDFVFMSKHRDSIKDKGHLSQIVYLLHANEKYNSSMHIKC